MWDILPVRGDYYRVVSRDNGLCLGTLNDGVDTGDLEILVIPGVVFGIGGERIGMGAGFYDRFLVQAKGALRAGFAFDFQVLGEPIPQNPWDARMDVIVTDQRLIEVEARPF
jgi:5-formyltetrahydrofolate cyclo-ligase